MITAYIASRLSQDEGELLRRHSFTRWMSADLLQTANDLLKNLGLLAIYTECSSEGMFRYLCWRPPEGWGCEVRSGRPLAQFEKFDEVNVKRGFPLLSLHINESDLYSAVWISPNVYEIAKKVLAGYGITPAARASKA